MLSVVFIWKTISRFRPRAMGNGDRETEAVAERIGEALASVLAEPPPSAGR